METPKRISVNEELFKLLVGRGKKKDVVTEMLSWNMVTKSWFSYLTDISTARISQLTDPVDPKLEVVFPFRNFEKKYKDRTGPGFILIDEKAINYIKKMPYERKSKVSQ